MKFFKRSTKPQQSNKNFLALISSLMLCSSIFPLVATANLTSTILFQPPPEEEQPETTEGAASRRNRECSQDFIRQQEPIHNRLTLTAVAPNNNYGLTVKDRPDFWVYLPKTSAQQAILTIKEEGIKPHWEQPIKLAGDVGIVKIELPDNAPSLEIGKNYQWALVLVCGNRPNPNDPVVAAWIKRVDESQVIDPYSPSQSIIQKAASYAQKGVWYDALDILIEEKELFLDDWQDMLFKYLQSGGLDKIANEPIISRE